MERNAYDRLFASIPKNELYSLVTGYLYIFVKVGKELRATYHSRHCKAITGYRPEEYLINKDLWLDIVHPEDRDKVSEHATALSNGESAPPIEHRIIHRDGTIRSVRNSAIPTCAQDGCVVRIDGLVIDITDGKRKETATR